MAEIPSNIILADQFNKYVDGYSIGSNDLTMLILGCDRDNDTVSHIYDERNLAVRRAIRHLIEVAHKDGKTVSICGTRIPLNLPKNWQRRLNSASCWTHLPAEAAPKAKTLTGKIW